MEVFGIILISLAVISLILFFLKASSFINNGEIFKKYFESFNKATVQMTLMYFIPLFLTAGIIVLTIPAKKYFNQDFFTVLITIIGFFLSMLFMVLSLFAFKDYNNVKDENQQENAKEVILQTISIVIVNIFLCLIILILTLITITNFEKWFVDKNAMQYISTSIILYFSFLLLMNLPVIIKHLYNVVQFNLHYEKK